MGRIKKKGGLENSFFSDGAGGDEEPTKSAETVYTPDLTHEEAFTAFSGVNLADARKQIKVENVALDIIHPDPAQPRRAIPLSVRMGAGVSHVNNESLPALFTYWLEAVNAVRETPFNLNDYLSLKITDRGNRVVDEDEKDDGNTGTPSTPLPHIDDAEASGKPVEDSLMRIVELAASIREVGLLNPITVAPLDVMTGTYVIETGERRWLAYCLLKWHFGVADEHKTRSKLRWDMIPAIKVEAPDVWRQAVENNARDNLNAIGKARQLALLLMHLHGPENFEPLGTFEHEQDYYAQVADGNTYRIYRNKSEQLAGALNLKSPKQIRDYRRLLRIDRKLWDAADENDWGEGTIRSKMNSAASVPNGAVPAQAPSFPTLNGDSEPNGTVANPVVAPIYKLEKRYNEKKLRQMSAEERQQVIDELSSLTKHIKRLVKDMEKETAGSD